MPSRSSDILSPAVSPGGEPGRPGAAPGAEGARPLSVIEDLLAVPSSDGTSRPITTFASQLLAVLGRHAGTWVSAVVDRDDGRGPATIATAGRPASLAGPLVVETPLALSAPWTGVLRMPRTPGAELTPELLAAERLTAQRLATALEYERLRQADLRRQSWLTYLLEVGDLLAHSIDTQLTEALIPRLVVPRLVEWCALYTLDTKGVPRIATVAHTDEAAAANMLSPQHAFGKLLNGKAMLETVLGATGAVVAGVPDCLVIPMHAHGQRVGALALGGPGIGDSESVSIAEEVARRGAAALDNARVHDERRHISHTLQQALLPPTLPVVPGLGIGTSYLPAGQYNQVGGDMYDLITLPGGDCVAVIGDVAGKGVQAATVTGIVREVLRVLLIEGKPVTEALDALNETIRSRCQRYCTMALAHVQAPMSGHDLSGHDLPVTLYLAGHDQPVLVRRHGDVQPVGVWGTALGVLPRVHCVPETVLLRPGDSLIMFTDGVTERRDGDEFFGLEGVCESAAQLAAHPADVIAQGLATLALDYAAEEPRDDITIVALRNDVQPPA